MGTATGRSRRRRLPALLGLVVLAGGSLPVAPPVTAASLVTAGFQETIVWSGLSRPTAIRFAADGRVFVAEKRGAIKVFDDLDDTTPTTFTGLLTNVHDFWDRGLLGLALDPSLTGGTGTGSYVYVLYTYDHVLGSTDAAPRWGDGCPTPPGALSAGCEVSGRLSRFEVSGSSVTGDEQVLIEDWCQQFPSHSIGNLAFGPDGSLYASAGDGAKFTQVDYGQFGGNPCADPPGGTMSSPTAEGGALRSQDRRSSTDPQTLDGAVLRVNPATGAGMPGNPFAASTDANARRIIAYGFRNPFRFALRPGTNELWVGDVGWETWEEINRVPNAVDSVAENFGWPCYEGVPKQPGYDAANLSLCETLYGQGPGAVAVPAFTYSQADQVVDGETCPIGGSSITGLAFYPESGGSYPAGYAGGLFMADHTRDCIWFMPKGSNGQPDPNAIQRFVDGAPNPIDLQVGPGGDLFYVDFDGGTIRRVTATGGDIPPTASLRASPSSGPAPLTVQFDSVGSFDPEAGPLTYAWDLDGDGQLDDSTSPSPQWTYSDLGDVTTRLRVTDQAGLSGTATEVISVANTPPVPIIATPVTGTTWKVGDAMSFSGSATDEQDGPLPASALSWSLVMQHCPSNCHAHTIQSWAGVSSGSFNGEDHEYPSYLELTLTATDTLGKSASVTRRLDPKTVALTFKSVPNTMAIAVNQATGNTTFSRTVIVGSSNSVSAVSPQTYIGATWTFASWSDGKAGTHDIVAPATPTTYTATFKTRAKFFRPVADAQVRSLWPSKNYGSSATLRVLSARSRAYLKFTVTGLSGPASSAKLRLWVTEGSSGGGSVYRVSNAWTESGITWNNRPLVTGSPRSTLGGVSAGTWVEFDLGSLITGNGTYSVAITSGNTDPVDYASRETTRDPYLVVTP